MDNTLKELLIHEKRDNVTPVIPCKEYHINCIEFPVLLTLKTIND